MGLQDLNENLYERNFDTKHIETRYEGEAGMAAQDFQTRAWGEKPAPSIGAVNESFIRRRKWILIGAGIIGIGALIASAFFVRKMLFTDTKVSLAIEGAQSVANTESITFSLQYTNTNWVSLHNAEIVLSYPKGFHPEVKAGWTAADTRLTIPVGNISSRTVGRIDVTGRFFGSKGDLLFLDATLRYEPSQMSEIFSYDTRFGVTISTAPIVLEADAPKMAATGDTVEYVVHYENTEGGTFSNIRVKGTYPDTFQFVSASPAPSEGKDTWYIGDLAGKTSGTIHVTGTLSGDRNEVKSVSFSIGYPQGDGSFLSYNTAEQSTRIASSPLAITQTVNDSRTLTTTLGSVLNYQIRYKNEGNIGFRDVIVTLDFDTSVLDFSRLQKRSGYFDAEKNRLIWKASDIPELSVLDPGESGEIDFTVPVLAQAQGISGKHFGIRSVARIDSPDVPTPEGSNKIIASNSMDVRLNSAIDLAVKGRYYDASVENTGPIPPKVGMQTTYALSLSLSNSFNDVSGARVVASLPSGVRFTGKISPDTETVTFNSRTNELVWEIGNFSAGEENVSREVTVQVAVIPGPSDAGNDVRLLNKAVLFAKDSFTGEDIKKEQGEKTTALPEDTKMNSSGYQVRK
jgi:hypothetical protein